MSIWGHTRLAPGGTPYKTLWGAGGRAWRPGRPGGHALPGASRLDVVRGDSLCLES
jgi:hypothetical protein